MSRIIDSGHLADEQPEQADMLDEMPFGLVRFDVMGASHATLMEVQDWETIEMSVLGLEPLLHDEAAVRDCRLGRYTEIGRRTSLVETTLDDYSYVASDSDIIFSTIGKFCSIAAHVRINPGNHPMDRASQSHFTYRASRYFPGETDEAAFFAWRRSHPVSIGHDVWIGHGAVVLPGRTIGTGAVIAAGAIVTKDVDAYMIVAGNPARLIRPRFPAEIAQALQAIAWWDWSHERLRKTLSDFCSLAAADFIAKHL